MREYLSLAELTKVEARRHDLMRGVRLFFKKGIKNFLLCSRLRFFITSPSLCALGCVCDFF